MANRRTISLDGRWSQRIVDVEIEAFFVIGGRERSIACCLEPIEWLQMETSRIKLGRTMHVQQSGVMISCQW